jgi:hypothetical protein
MQPSWGVEFSSPCIWSIRMYELLEGVSRMLMNWIYLIECFWYSIHHHEHYHHYYHDSSQWPSYHWHHCYWPWTDCTHVHLQSVGCRQQILLEHLIPKSQFSTFSAQCKIVIVIAVTMRHCKISLGWLHDVMVHTIISIDIMISATICSPLPTTHDLPPGGAWWLQLFKSCN